MLDIDPTALNADLAARLRGCALVCEIDINAALHSELIEAMKKLKAHGITEDKDSLRKYAALVTTYLVAEGIFNFADGTFFPNLSVQVPRARLIYVFEFALDIYRGLERFQPLVDAGALRYLAPILAHGGIPQYSLGDFFSVVLDAERRGAIDGRDMIAYWREHPSAFASSDRAVERFLLYGGDISLDFLDRSLDLIRSRPATEGDLPADQFGLPAYVCDAFLALAPNTRRAYHSSGQDGRVGSAVPRPSVIIDPWDAIGPIVVLPPVGGQLRDTSWSVLATDGATRYDGSSTERYASLSPALHWTVEMRDRTGNEVRTFTFPGLARSGALFFDYDDRNLITDLTRLRGGRVWILRVAGEKGLVQLPSGARLEPVETVPPLTGMWDGYVLNAYDLSKTEKIVIGIAGDTSLWVRIRSDRIALGGESLPGVNTSEGLPVYAEAPELILPGFNAVSQPNGLWFVRVTCDGIEHTFDTEALKSKDSDPIRSVTPVDRISRVQVMARGPLGMDLRAEFCIVPHLSIQRPERVLLPATKPDQVVSHVLVRAPDSVVRRLDVLGGMDTVAVDVSDVYGKLANIRIEVPCLQWALVTDTGARTELGQQLIRASVRDVIDGGVSLLIIRTRRAATFIKLQLRHDVRILSEMEGTTAGDDGRWAFDMRGFSDAIRESNEPVLSLLLIIGGYDVTVGSVRAELEATDLTIHQRTGGSETTLTLTWNESRPLRHRVVRLWPLTMPWNRPVSVPVDDEAHGVVTLTKVNEEMPPGCYVAELGIDDGWSTARRPNIHWPSVKQFRLGTERDEKLWIDQLGNADAYSVLANAYTFADGGRPLTASEILSVTPAALEALLVARELGRGAVSPQAIKAVTSLIVTDRDALVRGLESAALNWADGHGEAFIAAVLDLIPAIAHIPIESCVCDVGNLWELCPPLAASLDLPQIGSDIKSRGRCEAGLGASLSDALKRDIIPPTRGRVPELQIFTQLPITDLEAQRKACSLFPKRPMDLDTQAAAQFEWLIADRKGDFSAKAWAATSYALVERSNEFRPDLAAKLEAIRAPAQMREVFPAIAFPEVVWAAALHVVANTPSSTGAVAALREIIAYCPIIVRRSLVLAAVHTYATN